MTLEELQAGQVLLVDKPLEWTSFDVIRKLQGASGYRKFGHAGTLDPLATGLLIICCGRATKTIESYQGQEKEYIAEFLLGGATKTYDAEFLPEKYADASHVSRVELEAAMEREYTGEITQTPPAYSAIKIKGKRAYELARQNKEVTLKSRQVTVYSLELLSLENATRDGKTVLVGSARVVCSKGTYIRSLFHDIGATLGVGGHLTGLRRTRIGEYLVQNALSVEEAVAKVELAREK